MSIIARFFTSVHQNFQPKVKEKVDLNVMLPSHFIHNRKLFQITILRSSQQVVQTIYII